MKASSAAAFSVVLFSLGAVPARAMVTSPAAVLSTGAAEPLIVNADFVQGHEAIAGIPAREALTSGQNAKMMAARYFDADAILTLGALALASGAFVASGVAGARRRASAPAPVVRSEDWRESVMRAVEADLMAFTTAQRQAA